MTEEELNKGVYFLENPDEMPVNVREVETIAWPPNKSLEELLDTPGGMAVLSIKEILHPSVVKVLHAYAVDINASQRLKEDELAMKTNAQANYGIRHNGAGGTNNNITESEFPVKLVAKLIKTALLKYLGLSTESKLAQAMNLWEDRLFVPVYLCELLFLGPHTHNKPSDKLEHFLICGTTLATTKGGSYKIKTVCTGIDYLRIHQRIWDSIDGSMFIMLGKGNS